MLQPTAIARPSGTAPAAPYRVMIVDDSAVIRGFLIRWLDAEPDIEVVAIANNGAHALREFDRACPELVILDIEMPEMDGLTALPALVSRDPDVQVIMASTLTRRNADVSLRALAMGAADYIAKPESTRVVNEKELFQKSLVEKIRALGATRRAREAERGKLRPRPAPTAAPMVAPLRPAMPKPPARSTAISLRPLPLVPAPKAIAIGASTGGPQALFKLFELLNGKIDLPIFITQHMPETFTAILAEHLNKIYDKECVEAKDGQKVSRNGVYVAPGNWHMTVVGQGGDYYIRLNQEPPENFCRPSVEPMLRSLHACFGANLLTVMLTGMGHDGLDGCKLLAEAGAVLIAQDEATSVVWGMPGAVANAGICNRVLPLQEIPQSIQDIINGRLV